jgi:hypothetical protein
MVDAGGVVIWLGSAAEDLVRGTVHSIPSKRHARYDSNAMECYGT